MTTTQSPVVAPVVTLFVSFAIVFSLGQVIGGPAPESEPPRNQPTLAPTAEPTEPPAPPEQHCNPIDGVLVNQNNELVACSPSAPQSWPTKRGLPHGGGSPGEENQ